MAAAVVPDSINWIQFLRNFPNKLRFKFVEFSAAYFLVEFKMELGLFSLDHYRDQLVYNLNSQWEIQDYGLMVASFRQYLSDTCGLVWPEEEFRPPSVYLCLDPRHLQRVFACRHDPHRSNCQRCDPRGFKTQIVQEIYARSVSRIARALAAEKDLYKDVRRAVDDLKPPPPTLRVAPLPRPAPQPQSDSDQSSQDQDTDPESYDSDLE